MQESDAVMAVLDRYDAGILGEESDGTLRAVFGRTCEMVTDLVLELQKLNKELVFPHSVGATLFLNVVSNVDNAKKDKNTTNVKKIADIMADFIWLSNKMGLYTFSKTKLAGSSLNHLLTLLAQENVKATILEDEPGTDSFYVHCVSVPMFQGLASLFNGLSQKRVETVEKSDKGATVESYKQRNTIDEKDATSTTHNTRNTSNLFWVVFVFTLLVGIIAIEPIHPHHEWVLRTVSTLYMKILTFLSS